MICFDFAVVSILNVVLNGSIASIGEDRAHHANISV